jgi:hypothetical protein
MNVLVSVSDTVTSKNTDLSVIGTVTSKNTDLSSRITLYVNPLYFNFPKSVKIVSAALGLSNLHSQLRNSSLQTRQNAVFQSPLCWAHRITPPFCLTKETKLASKSGL